MVIVRKHIGEELFFQILNKTETRNIETKSPRPQPSRPIPRPSEIGLETYRNRDLSPDYNIPALILPSGLPSTARTRPDLGSTVLLIGRIAVPRGLLLQTEQRGLSVCLSVCHDRAPCRNR